MRDFMEKILLKDALEKLNMSNELINTFIGLKGSSESGVKLNSNWDDIKSPDEKNLHKYDLIKTPNEENSRKALSKLVMCKLNGGLGTGMGCTGPKSSIVVRNGKTFIDLILEQLRDLKENTGVNIPLILMNSFHTHVDTQNTLDLVSKDLNVECFQQNRFPRLDKETGLPLDEAVFGVETWYPPGHGDIYRCLYSQGLIDSLIEQGKEILFVSNADNLGAIADEKILCHMLQNDIPFLMEMTEKTPADVKGGTLYQENDRLRLLEIAQVPDEYIDEFASIKKFQIFNTNNIWINLIHLKKRLDQGEMDMPVIVNEKSVSGKIAIQLETAIGSALDQFNSAVGLSVGRERFLPVKKTSDLLIAQSNLIEFENGRPIKNPKRSLNYLPNIMWGDEFKNVDDYLHRIPEPPDMLELEELNIQGDVKIGANVVLKGRVSLNGRDNALSIPNGSVVENSDIFGKSY
ncbi:MAG: UTP--glucose-1-phosphate uridylyltransferase [Nitrospinales bacterium]